MAGACEKCWEMLGAAARRGLRRAELFPVGCGARVILSSPVSRSATGFNFLHSGPNSAQTSFGYRKSGGRSFPGRLLVLRVQVKLEEMLQILRKQR